jgi:subtilase family serine protease
MIKFGHSIPRWLAAAAAMLATPCWAADPINPQALFSAALEREPKAPAVAPQSSSAAKAPSAIALAQAAPAAAAATPVDFEVFLPVRNTAALQQLLIDQQTPGAANYQKWLTPSQYAAQFGPTQTSLNKVQAAMKAAGFVVDAVHARSFHARGTADQINRTFQTQLYAVAETNGRVRMVAQVRPTMPLALQQEGAQIVSFTGGPRKHSFAVRTRAAAPDNRNGADGPYWFDDLKQAYDYPSYQSVLPNGQPLDGTGVRVAVVMADLLYPGDLATYFEHEHFSAVTGKPDPSVTTVPIAGGGTTGGDESLEASLDVQQVLGGAPGATVTLVSIPDLLDDHIMAGYNYIVANPQLYDVVTSSFGVCEIYYTAPYNGGRDDTSVLRMYDEIFQQGVAEGITFVASTGDSGGLECTTPSYEISGHAGVFIKGVSTPATSAFVTAVGGGNLVTATPFGIRNSTYVGENGFGDALTPYDPDSTGGTATGGYWGAGGGRSVIEARPSYQASFDTGSTFRTLPDVGMQVGGCPDNAIQQCAPDRSDAMMVYNGVVQGVIGTSVAAPEFAGALALYVQMQGHKVGNINPYLYRMGQAQTAAGGASASPARQYYHRNIQGFDGVWAGNYPSLNYNYIYGNGSPDVRKLFGMTGFAPAGVPQTATNP